MVQHEIIGDDMQAVTLSMGPGDVVRAGAGAMMTCFRGDKEDVKRDLRGVLGRLGGLIGGDR